MTEQPLPPAERPDDTPFAARATIAPAEAVAGLVTAGLPLEAGLLALSEEVPSPGMRHLLRDMSQALAQGQSPDIVLSRPVYGMPNYLRGLVKAGVQSGQLGSFLEQFLVTLRRRRQAALSFWGMMAYPLLLMPFVFMIGAIILAWVVPQFRDIFNDFGVDLPGATMALLTLSSKPVLIGIFIGVPVLFLLTYALIFAGQFLPGHAGRVRMFQQIPIVGTPSRQRGLAEFCSLLGLLVSGRIPLPEALRMTASAIHDGNLEQGAKRLATRVEQGDSLEEAAHGLPQISRELVHLFRWAPRGDAFGDILLRAGEIYSSESRVQAGLTVMIFQPLILFGIAVFGGFVVTALFMPLIKLLNELS